MSEGKAIRSADAGTDKRFLASESISDLKIRSVMCAPLIGSANKPLGMIQIDTRRGPFSAGDLDVLVNVANLAGQALAHARLHETRLQYDRRERDMMVARQVQLHFLPHERPSMTAGGPERIMSPVTLHESGWTRATCTTGPSTPWR